MATDRDALGDVAGAVRRALAARTSDPHLIDDLTQETLLRLARTERELTTDERRAYAVVVARNLLVSHFRGQSVQRRHIHRLVDNAGATDPEQHTIDNEEGAAMASALTRIDPRDRDLLVRHEVSGTDLATLAGEADVSPGAIAMRLARARANLRLEFLLVFRRVSLPTTQCRPVLLALAAGDHRRQTQLGATEHLERCPTCAALLAPMTERNRRVAAWLVVPLGDAARRVRRAFRSWWVRVASIAIVLAGIGSVVILLADDSDGADDHSAGAPGPNNVVAVAPGPTSVTVPATTAATTAPPAPTAPATAPATVPVPAAPAPGAPPSAAASVAPPPPTAARSTAAPTTTVASAAATPTCPPPAPLSDLDLPAAVGCPFAVSLVTVVAVSSGAELTATAGGRSVSVQLLDGGLPVTVLPGTRLSIAGTVDAFSGGQLAVSVSGVSVTG